MCHAAEEGYAVAEDEKVAVMVPASIVAKIQAALRERDRTMESCESFAAKRSMIALVRAELETLTPTLRIGKLP